MMSTTEIDAPSAVLSIPAVKASALLLDAQSLARIVEVGLAACRELGCPEAMLVLIGEDGFRTVHQLIEGGFVARSHLPPTPSCNPGGASEQTIELTDASGRLIGLLMAAPPDDEICEQLHIVALQLAAAVGKVHTLDAMSAAQIQADNMKRTLTRLKEDIDITQEISGTATLRWNYVTGKDHWSRNLYFLLGYDPLTDEPDYQKFLLGAHPEDKPVWFRISKEAVDNAKPFRWEGRYYKPNGELRHFLIQGRPDVDTWYHGTLMDVTDLKQNEEDLRRLQLEVDQAARLTTMGELAASIAHEINQPLTSISANASASQRWLNREVPNFDQLRASLYAIIQDSQRAGEVIRGLQALDESRPSQQRPADLSTIVHRVVDVMKPNAVLHNIVLRSEIEAGPFVVKCEQTQIEQLFHNLIMNALEAVEVIEGRPRMVLVQGRAEAGTLKFTVEDTGTGIESETAAKLFDPFYTTKATGMGMGLAICRSIVEAHDGTIRAHSRTPYGTIFEVELPATSIGNDG